MAGLVHPIAGMGVINAGRGVANCGPSTGSSGSSSAESSESCTNGFTQGQEKQKFGDMGFTEKGIECATRITRTGLKCTPPPDKSAPDPTAAMLSEINTTCEKKVAGGK